MAKRALLPPSELWRRRAALICAASVAACVDHDQAHVALWLAHGMRSVRYGCLTCCCRENKPVGFVSRRFVIAQAGVIVRSAGWSWSAFYPKGVTSIYLYFFLNVYEALYGCCAGGFRVVAIGFTTL